MNNKFVILHLSDAHIGHPDYSLDSLKVFDPLYQDLKKAAEKDKLVPSLIVFSGDLAYGEIPKKTIKEQYKEATKFLSDIFASFGKGYGDIPILIVPGNHDINRDVIDDAHKEYRKNLNAEIVTRIMKENKHTWKNIVARQSEWFEFVKNIPKQPWVIDPDIYSVTGIIQHKDKKIGVVGLNTSWASHENNEQGLLWIGEYQYDKAYRSINDADFKIAVSHHPVDYLHPEEKNYLHQKIQTQFQIYLHGHEHTQWYDQDVKHLKCHAGACYSNSKGKNRYSWLVLDFVTGDSQIHLREYTDEGAGGWRANEIPEKTNEQGIGELKFLKEVIGVSDISPEAGFKTQQTNTFPSDLLLFVKALEDRFYFRFEKETLPPTLGMSLVYWPVRLRQPTPIHAAQCFVAAGLQKLGCKIILWIDDLGNKEYPTEKFISTLLNWYKKAGGDDKEIIVRQFEEIINGDSKHVEPAWTMLQKWLGNTVYMTDHILKISKLWPATEEPTQEEPSIILDEIKKRRPRRLMTPSMVWTCLSVLHQENKKLPIITLGGYDEQGLWDAWRKCCNIPEMPVGHLYISKLTKKTSYGEHAVHMSDEELAWTSKEDIERTFTKATSSDDSNMIEWTINNCVLLPNYVSQKTSSLNIKGHQINTLNDIRQFKPNDIVHDAAEEVNSWLF